MLLFFSFFYETHSLPMFLGIKTCLTKVQLFLKILPVKSNSIKIIDEHAIALHVEFFYGNKLMQLVIDKFCSSFQHKA